MANIVWHEKWGIELNLTRDDLGHESIPNLWELLYQSDRIDALRNVPVASRGLQCGGVCREAGVIAWMYLRVKSNGRREAVHERSEDEQRHHASLSDEHKAYQERIVRAADSVGYPADSEVRTAVGPRSWVQTDTLVQGENGIRIGWEIQLSSAGAEGPRSVKARASRAAKNGITPAWHTDRSDYASRTDTHWTRSDNLPAAVIASPATFVSSPAFVCSTSGGATSEPSTAARTPQVGAASGTSPRSRATCSSTTWCARPPPG